MTLKDLWMLLAIAVLGTIVFVSNLHLAKKLSFP
jgi:hypothetical protein